jgi:Na+/melibiose symporter-like transporter
VFLALFVRRQRAIDDPLIDLRIFDSRIFSDGLLTSVFLYSCFIGITLVIPLYVQGVRGGTSLDSGLVILPTTVTALLVNPLAGMLADKTSARLACLIFGAFLVVGSVAYVFVQPDTPFWFLATFQTLRGIGVSGLIGPLVTYSLAGLEGSLVSHGSTAMVIVRQVAATFSTAVMVLCIAMFGSLAAEGAVPAVLPYQVAFGFSALMAVLCLIFVVAKVKTR